MRNIIAGNISRHRKDLSMTQEALAERLGITFQAVSKWETGQTIPDSSLLPSLAHALNVSIDTLPIGYLQEIRWRSRLWANHARRRHGGDT
jgi:tellurite methyltransferase